MPQGDLEFSSSAFLSDTGAHAHECTHFSASKMLSATLGMIQETQTEIAHVHYFHLKRDRVRQETLFCRMKSLKWDSGTFISISIAFSLPDSFCTPPPQPLIHHTDLASKRSPAKIWLFFKRNPATLRLFLQKTLAQGHCHIHTHHCQIHTHYSHAHAPRHPHPHTPLPRTHAQQHVSTRAFTHTHSQKLYLPLTHEERNKNTSRTPFWIIF